MRKSAAKLVNMLDKNLSLLHVSVCKEKPALLGFLFHSLYENKQAFNPGIVDAQQKITVAVFSEFIERFLSSGYVFISPEAIVAGLDADKKYALLTFDDGYFNNHLALPVLRQYKVPAVFYISTSHVAANKSFWWDALYRQRLKTNNAWQQAGSEYELLKQKKNQEIEAYLLERFGPQCLQPVGDLDRPFTPAELQAFAREPYVTIGNHTHNHAILTNYTATEVEAELLAAQQYLAQLLGAAPTSVAYPNGNYSRQVLAIAQKLGFQTGVTVQENKNKLPLPAVDSALLALNRFLLWGDKNIKQQCNLFRSDLHIKQLLKHR